ncbi:uncharacterized protein CTHT_0041280 [Thermochaetoides thermophila DSM 1495]|uniref:Uncharacterized protein n=1 Tax=Chaetomium thermophilum (strain DSM 1495 / CBS 144.50 / IMI 039719) TaxID=759272 RepID=G0SA77_CHATD|nr:hypothetical protein CTHT_0041280 [Thermochaetoides thermophila DSM 1495]EGS19649.1 hypothetical protein CTHT_0041280 [Thermochaetoides thermophila DSM 1495]
MPNNLAVPNTPRGQSGSLSPSSPDQTSSFQHPNTSDTNSEQTAIHDRDTIPGGPASTKPKGAIDNLIDDLYDWLEVLPRICDGNLPAKFVVTLLLQSYLNDRLRPNITWLMASADLLSLLCEYCLCGLLHRGFSDAEVRAGRCVCEKYRNVWTFKFCVRVRRVEEGADGRLQFIRGPLVPQGSA